MYVHYLNPPFTGTANLTVGKVDKRQAQIEKKRKKRTEVKDDKQSPNKTPRARHYQIARGFLFFYIFHFHHPKNEKVYFG